MEKSIKGYGAKEKVASKAAPKNVKKDSKMESKEKFMKMINAKKKKK